VVDFRNHYESEIGILKGHYTDVDTFHESLPIIEQLKDFKEDKNLVMYCTGGFVVKKLRLILNTKGLKCIPTRRRNINYMQTDKKNLE
jgi:UPF0176 protein